jgi:Flp pilus assembly protein TadG
MRLMDGPGPPPVVSMRLRGCWKRRGGRRIHNERGASALELAVALPILLMLVFGTITSGLALFDKISLNGAAREAGRFGATYPEEDAASPDAWFVDVATVAQIAATGALTEGVSGRSICVARGSEGASVRRYVVGTSDPIDAGVYADAWCVSGEPDLPVGSGHEAVQIVVERDAHIQALIFSRTVQLASDATTRFER